MYCFVCIHSYTHLAGERNLQVLIHLREVVVSLQTPQMTPLNTRQALNTERNRQRRTMETRKGYIVIQLRRGIDKHPPQVLQNDVKGKSIPQVQNEIHPLQGHMANRKGDIDMTNL